MCSKPDNDKPGDKGEPIEPLPDDPAYPLGLPADLHRAEKVAGAPPAGAPGDHGVALYRVTPGEKISLADTDCNAAGEHDTKESAKKELKHLRTHLQELQTRLYAEGRQSLLIILQAMDTGGKDGTIRHVFHGVNPQGCQVWPFKVPTPEELAHDFLWRCHVKCPARGMIAIFNRSYYEDVLVAKVNSLAPPGVIEERYRSINDFERTLALNNTTILKFYLQISPDEQKERLQARLDEPDKNWKYNPGDLLDRAHWDEYSAAYEDALNKCSTSYAPWYVVPANRKWWRNLAIARTIVATLTAMDPHYPDPAPDLDKQIIV
jgi:PPK2 family polyphosphate:nucleotide phosphotransferase